MAVVGDETRSRRGLLAGAIGGIAALALDTFARPRRADAANGDTVKVGQVKTGTTLTQINASSSAFKGRTTGSGTSGIIGESSSGTGFGVNGFNLATTGTPIGVRGAASGNGIGVYGNAARGVLGENSGAGGVGVVGKNNSQSGSGSGMRAFASSPDADALYAENNSATGGVGTAFHAVSSTVLAAKIENVSGLALGIGLSSVAPNIGLHGSLPSGATTQPAGVKGDTGLTANTVLDAAGVRGEADKQNHFGGLFRNTSQDGYALKVDGGLLLAGCAGRATVASATSTVTVSPSVPVYTTSFVLATLQQNAGSVHVQSVVTNPNADTFTIHLSGNAPPGGLVVGWLLAS